MASSNYGSTPLLQSQLPSQQMPPEQTQGTPPGSAESWHLLRGGPHWHSLLRGGGPDSGIKGPGAPNIWELIFVPWMCLALILVCTLLAHGSTQFMIWLPFVLLILLIAVFIYLQFRQGKTSGAILGILCFVACVAGFVVALYAYNRFLSDYWHVMRGASYFSVNPQELAAARSDATSITFVPGTKVDVSQTYGFLGGGSDRITYCVAPILLNPDAEKRIQYWAAGTNCCYMRSNFQCGDADVPGDSTAWGGTVYNPDSVAEGFKEAVTGAQFAYGLQAGDGFLLLNWRGDPMTWRDGLYHNTIVLFLIFAGVYLLLSCAAGLALNQTFKAY